MWNLLGKQVEAFEELSFLDVICISVSIIDNNLNCNFFVIIFLEGRYNLEEVSGRKLSLLPGSLIYVTLLLGRYT